MSQTQWARLRATETGHLRRGAWYRVVRLTPSEVVLDVHGTPTPVPRTSLEILSTPPSRWAIVPRPPHSARLPQSWGARYGVCPNCRNRARLEERAVSMRCPKCNGFFDIGWDNS